MVAAETESERIGPHGGNPPTTTPAPFVDAEKAAEFLSFRRRRVSELARQGRIPVHPMGRGKRRVWRSRLSELAAAVRSSSKNKPCTPVYKPCSTRVKSVSHGPCLTLFSQLPQAASWICIRSGVVWFSLCGGSRKPHRAISRAEVGSCVAFPGGYMRAAHYRSGQAGTKKGAAQRSLPAESAKPGWSKEAAMRLGRGAPQER